MSLYVEGEVFVTVACVSVVTATVVLCCQQQNM